MEQVSLQIELAHLGVGDPDAGWVSVGVELRLNRQTGLGGLGGRGGDELDDGLVTALKIVDHGQHFAQRLASAGQFTTSATSEPDGIWSQWRRWS